MKPGKKMRSRLQVAGVGAAPVALILLVRTMMPGAPAQAPAAQPVVDATPPVAAPIAGPGLTPAQVRAAAWARRPASGPLASPMDHPAATAAPSDPGPTAAAPPPPSQTEAATPTLTAILGRGETARVLIDGRVMKMGDQTAGGWTIEGIEPRRQCVSVRHQDGRTADITISPK